MKKIDRAHWLPAMDVNGDEVYFKYDDEEFLREVEDIYADRIVFYTIEYDENHNCTGWKKKTTYTAKFKGQG